MSSAKTAIVFHQEPEYADCWICNTSGAFQYFDSAVDEYYCPECIDGAIIADHVLSFFIRKHPKPGQQWLLRGGIQ
jgi:Zn finger protein HypA/HybF involved in hydrogenase expression